MKSQNTSKKQFVISKENVSFLKKKSKVSGRNMSYLCNQALELYRGLAEAGLRFSDLEFLVQRTDFETTGSLLYEASRHRIQEIYNEWDEKQTWMRIEDYEKDLYKKKLAVILKLTLTYEDVVKLVGESIVQPSESNSVQETDASLEKITSGAYEENGIFFLQLDNGEFRVFTYALSMMKHKH